MARTRYTFAQTTMQSGTKHSQAHGDTGARHDPARVAQPRLTPLDYVFRALAAFGVVEIAELAYQLAAYPGVPGVVGQP